MDNKGTDSKEGCSDWCIVEAECSDLSDLDETLDKLFEEGTDSDISDLIDDGDTVQGNSLELLCQQESEESEQQLSYLKRKYLSPIAVAQPLSRSAVRARRAPTCRLARRRGGWGRCRPVRREPRAGGRPRRRSCGQARRRRPATRPVVP